MPLTVRPDPARAERNLRNLVANGERMGAYVVQTYRQDLIDILGELERLRGEVNAHNFSVVVLRKAGGRG